MTAIVREEASDVHSRLAELGLQEVALQDCVRRGYLAFITCTANHPPLIPGIWAWGETVRALREYVIPIGWRRSDDNNYSVVIDPMERIAIAVATGNEGTGQAHATPSTKAPKGPNTLYAVEANQAQLDLFATVANSADATDDNDPIDERMTWILLIHRTPNEVRCELSLPLAMGADRRVDQWRERILLGAVPLDGDLLEIIPPTLPDINIDIKRRA